MTPPVGSGEVAVFRPTWAALGVWLGGGGALWLALAFVVGMRRDRLVHPAGGGMVDRDGFVVGLVVLGGLALAFGVWMARARLTIGEGWVRYRGLFRERAIEVEALRAVWVDRLMDGNPLPAGSLSLIGPGDRHLGVLRGSPWSLHTRERAARALEDAGVPVTYLVRASVREVAGAHPGAFSALESRRPWAIAIFFVAGVPLVLALAALAWWLTGMP